MIRPSTAILFDRARAVTSLVVVALLAFGCGDFSVDVRSTQSLSAADSAAIRALDSSYVAAWLANDSAAVLATLETDAVLFPAGARPLRGRGEAMAFWWPGDGSRTTITSYSATIDELAGTPPLAYVVGTSTLDFSYERDTVRSRGTSRTMTLTIVSRSADGRWRIKRRMWGPLAP